MTRSRRSGFTLIELALCLTLLAILVPLMYAYALGIEDRFTIGTWHRQTADRVRTVADTLEVDGQTAQLMDDAVQFRHGNCTIDYRVEAGGLIRADSCGKTQTLARDVDALTREPGGVLLVFSHRLRTSRTQQTSIFIAVEGG